MHRKKVQEQTKHQVVVFPTIDIYSYFRFWKQRVYNAHLPLVKYQEPIYANNCQESHGDDFANTSQCRKFEPKDGLIYSLKSMKHKIPELKAIKCLICVSLYNQSKHAINLTLNGIYKNLHEFRKRGISDRQIVIIIIQDGILKTLSDRKRRIFSKGENSCIQFYKTLDKHQKKPCCEIEQRINVVLDEMENYDRKGLSAQVEDNRDFPPSIEKNTSLLYQNYWWPSLTYYGQQKVPDGPEKLLLLTCWKHINGGKLSTHLWFFEGFCRYLKPQFCVAMDVGTAPESLGVVNLIKGFSFDKDIGGVTGFMSVDINFKSEEDGDADKHKGQNWITKYITTVERAQEYEYIFSHFFDKNAESALGFLHVLPGAWAAYRYEALIKSQKFQPHILQRSYFKMILNPEQDVKDFREANMYLAEDRILSLGIYCQVDSKYKLKYVPDAIAYTDPMKDHENLMNQRRRWINSSIYAFLFVFKNYYYNVMNTNHTWFRKYVTLNISMYLSFMSLVLTYISPSFYFFILYALINQIGFPGSSWVAKLVSFIYTVVFLSAVAGSLRGKAWVKHAHYISIILAGFNILLVLLGFFNIVVIYFAAVNNPLIETPGDQNSFDINQLTTSFRMMSIVVMGGIIFGSFFIILIIHIPTHFKFVIKVIANNISFIAYSGAYSQTMVIYGFCNIDDVSWGTKGSNSEGVNRFQKDKVFFLAKWILSNAIIAFIFLYIDIISQENGLNDRGGYVLIAISIVASSLILIKSIFAIYHQMKWLLTQKCCYSLIDHHTESDRKKKVDRYWEEDTADWQQNYEGKVERSILIPKKKSDEGMKKYMTSQSSK